MKDLPDLDQVFLAVDVRNTAPPGTGVASTSETTVDTAAALTFR